ncbi:hypothetical protein TthTF21_23100 (plasmid) [Thermus thermophilus]
MLDDVLRPIHGGTDEGPEPLYDFSTNANALGPNPVALAYLRRADPSRYPDPLYRRLRRALAEAHGVSPEQVAVGTGTSELIHRLARWTYLRGPILLLPPTFGEYARAARALDLPLWEAESPEAFLELLPKSSLAFLCVPNNPTGEVYPFLEEAARRAGGALVLDLAYYDLMESPRPSPRRPSASIAPTRPTASRGSGRGTSWPPWTSPTSRTWPLPGPSPSTGRPSSTPTWTRRPGPGWRGAKGSSSASGASSPRGLGGLASRSGKAPPTSSWRGWEGPRRWRRP